MKAILEFNLPEEMESHNDALKGADYKYSLRDIDQFLRNKLKYEHNYANADEALIKVRDHLSDILKERNLEIWD